MNIDPYICEICSRKAGRDVRHVRGKNYVLHAGYARGIKVTGPFDNPVADSDAIPEELINNNIKDSIEDSIRKLYVDLGKEDSTQDFIKQLCHDVDPSLKDVDFEVEFDFSPINKPGWLTKLKNRLKRRKT